MKGRPINLNDKQIVEIRGLIPDSALPKGDYREHRDENELDN
jgi:hypothetical protein